MVKPVVAPCNCVIAAALSNCAEKEEYSRRSFLTVSASLCSCVFVLVVRGTIRALAAVFVSIAIMSVAHLCCVASAWNCCQQRKLRGLFLC